MKIFCFVCFVGLRPKSTAMVMTGQYGTGPNKTWDP